MLAGSRGALPLRRGLALGPYAEQDTRDGADGLTRFGAGLALLARQGRLGRGTAARRFVAKVDRLGESLSGLSPQALQAVISDHRAAMTSTPDPESLLARSFAITRECARRVLGKCHRPSQLHGGWVIARGLLAEMPTGEGKTLTATLPASFAAFAGIPVHVITANDYLARRDAESLGPLYRALGLSVAVASQGDSPEQRRYAYRADVTYCTAQQVAFDYLHDRVLRGEAPNRWQLQIGRLRGDESGLDRLLLRGLCYAIVDEADSVLIDEARTPLILSRAQGSAVDGSTCKRALALATRLQVGTHYRVLARERRVALTDAGRRWLDATSTSLGGLFAGRRYREFLITQALTAQAVFRRDRDYIVADGRVVIVDANTGRPMPERSWEQGLHQMVETLEGCELTGGREVLARTTMQRFFRRYLRVGGMSGTALEVAGELRRQYGLGVVAIAPHRPGRRRRLATVVHRDCEARRRDVVARIHTRTAVGQPVLVGTRSVEESERLSQCLDRAGIAHQVLNARQDRAEAEVVAAAGAPGRVTVATNMAGRGTDIELAGGVAERGGLHVIIAECNDARRIDRQLEGRAGRQGDPGSCEAVLALDDPLIAHYLHPWLAPAIARLAPGAGPLPARLGCWLARRAQRAVEREHRRQRRAVALAEDRLAENLAFAGEPE